MAKKSVSRGRKTARTVFRMTHLVFERRNYLLLLVGVLLILAGFVLMRLENEVDGVISLYLSPFLILGGYVDILYAIFWKPPAASQE